MNELDGTEAGLPPRQPARGAGGSRAGADRGERTCGLHHRRGGTAGGGQPRRPYRHFRDAEALLAEVALRGFDRLSLSLSQAWRDGKPEPIQAFENIGRAYLAFARREPAYYAAMFEARIDAEAHPGLLTASERAFTVLRLAAETVTAGAPKAGRPPALMVALHIWAMSHGIASLFCRADAGRRKLPMSPEELLEAGVLLYLQSLGLAGGK